MRTLGQKRAEFALDRVIGLPHSLKKDFKSFSAGAPATILQNGFGQTLAFWLSKNDAKHAALFEMIREWLVKNSFIQVPTGGNVDFIKALSHTNQREYLTAQKEALALLEWVKRYANAEL